MIQVTILMKPILTRRDFLKLASVLTLAPLAGITRLAGRKRGEQRGSQKLPNVIIILFDALSAKHLSLYDYPRQTSPNIERFANRASVYHAHYSAANFTTPSTASLLTGVYPWTHRAFHFEGLVNKEIISQNLFGLVGDAYHRIGFAHNMLADLLLYQLDKYLDQHVDIGEYCLIDDTFYNHLFQTDAPSAFRGLDRFVIRGESPGSLFLSYIYNLSLIARFRYYLSQYKKRYPRGLPSAGHINLTFELQSLFDGVIRLLSNLSTPSLAYLHLFPPHEPYHPRKNFINKFQDGWNPAPKEEHFFSEGVSDINLKQRRLRYDQYIATTDAEFGRLLNHLETTGLIDTSYVIVTSDHGQLFERGVHGHSTPLLYESIVRVPLIISRPQQSQREDIHSPTSTTDLLPSVLHIAGQQIPDWCAGQILPSIGGNEQNNRSIYAMDAKSNSAFGPLKKASIALIKRQYKLIYYIGYEGYDNVSELYDLRNDPEELENLYSPQHSVAQELQSELNQKLVEVNQL